MTEGLLGKVSWQHQKSNGAIYDNVRKKVLEFFPAGFSQTFIRPYPDIPGASEEVSRQILYKMLYDTAEELEREEEHYPFRDFEYTVHLENDPKNRYDKRAIKIVLNAPSHSPANEWLSHCLGYVPAKINKFIQLDRISDVRIHSVVNNLYNQYYCARISVFYDGKKGPGYNCGDDLRRFYNIVE